MILIRISYTSVHPQNLSGLLLHLLRNHRHPSAVCQQCRPAISQTLLSGAASRISTRTPTPPASTAFALFLPHGHTAIEIPSAALNLCWDLHEKIGCHEV
ncbi:hypothetical protein SDJN03_20752, partial [Cucurbita argyrosperma subsp. sororia]